MKNLKNMAVAFGNAAVEICTFAAAGNLLMAIAVPVSAFAVSQNFTEMDIKRIVAMGSFLGIYGYGVKHLVPRAVRRLVKFQMRHSL